MVQSVRLILNCRKQMMLVDILNFFTSQCNYSIFFLLGIGAE
jgi:hypothetical protein